MKLEILDTCIKRNLCLEKMLMEAKTTQLRLKNFLHARKCK